MKVELILNYESNMLKLRQNTYVYMNTFFFFDNLIIIEEQSQLIVYV